MSFFANLFGYVLKFLYDLVGNYGIAIILFSILVKLAMLPLTIKQQKSLKKNEKIQGEMKQIQFKYKNDPEKLNQEIMELYKREGMMPLSGCFTSIIQIILLLSVFLLVRSPLTYMVKMDTDVINKISTVVIEKDPSKNNAYKEISIIQYVKNLENGISVDENKTSEENSEENVIQDNNKNEISENVVDEKVEENKIEEGKSEEKTEETIDISKYIDKINLNMDFFGIDLTQVPTQNLNDWKTLAIPVLYVITSFISIKLTSQVTAKKKNEKNKLITDGTEEKDEQYNPTEDVNKTMTWMMPIMSVSIAIIAPLGLALYWLMNNILMIAERLIFDKILKKEEEAEKDA